MPNDKIIHLKSKLLSELDKPDINFQEIAVLSHELLEQDQDSVRFSIDAKHIHRLGYELVGKQETALSELIKNAYDADATEVRIEFKKYSEPGGKLVIQDDGHGMTADQIRNNWMRISTDDKEMNPFSPGFKRPRAGRKGIGRFAVERLGEELILETCVEGCNEGLRVLFNWDDDFKHGRDISLISHKIQKYPKESDKSGTTLFINELRDKWTERLFERVWKSVLLLQPPFRIAPAKDRSDRQEAADPGFKVYINGKSGDDVAKEVSIEKNFLDQRLAVITGTVDEKGVGEYKVVSNKLNFNDSTKAENMYLLTGSLYFEASYFIYSSDIISGVSTQQARQMGEIYGGIRIYRNGFRVLPYGESRDDWLKLARDTARRSLLVPANNFNFFGFVETTSGENILIEETSGREGLVENEAYEQLQNFVRTGIEWAVLRIAAFRKRKQKASQKDFFSELKKPSQLVDEVIEEVTDKIKAEHGNAKDLQNFRAIQRLEDLKQQAIHFEEMVEIREIEFVQYETMLRILASLGISISVFSHEVKGALTSFKSSLKDFLSTIDLDEIGKESLTEISSVNNRLFDLSNYITDLISHSSTREKTNIPLHAVIDSFVQQFDEYLNVRGISFEVDVDPPFLRTHKMHRSEIDSVLFNFMTNAVKAIQRAKADLRKIKISAFRRNGFAVISFQDTGTGIPVDARDKIFDAFYTTTQFSGDEIAGPGTGLGLKIVRDIAESNGGYVECSEPEQDYKCRFNFAVPIAKDQS
jgi:signal transduction histidine kinase